MIVCLTLKTGGRTTATASEKPKWAMTAGSVLSANLNESRIWLAVEVKVLCLALLASVNSPTTTGAVA